MISDNERREVAAKIRGNAYGRPFYGALVADAAGADPVDDEACWKRLADLIDPDNIPDNPDETACGLSGHCDRESLLAVAMRLGFESLEDSGDISKELEKRLMPKGMEWPTVDGELVVIGERMRSCGIEDCKVVGIDPANARLFLAFDDIEKERAVYFPDLAKDCHRPAPKVLDADGEEIREGDVLYRKSDGRMVEVAEVYEKTFIDADDCVRPGDGFTHRAPVLAADGEPLEVGQTVYATHYGYVKCTVLAIEWAVDDYLVEVENEGGHKFRQTPDEFIHQRPEPSDSWERIEEDAGKDCCVYYGKVPWTSCDGCPAKGVEDCNATMARDLVRRAKKLAGDA